MKYHRNKIEIDSYETNNGFAGDSFITCALYDGQEMTEAEIIEFEQQHPEHLYEYLVNALIKG